MKTTKYALITGASSGIGLEMAKALYPKYSLVLVARNAENLNKAKQELLSTNPNNSNDIVLISANLSHLNAAEEIFQECQKKPIEIEVLVNNAGIGAFGEHVEIEKDKINDMLILNVITLTHLCALFGKQMKERRCGYILNVASLAAYQPVPTISSYAASKSYVLNFSESLSKELEDYGVHTTCLSPGHTNTNFFQNAGIGDKTEGFFSLKTRVSPKQVAAIGLEALFAKRLSIIPGLKNNFLSSLHRFFPRKVTVLISKTLTKKP